MENSLLHFELLCLKINQRNADNMKQIFILFFFSLSTIYRVNAQDISVTGKVISSEDNSPLVGANVTIKGSTRGMITDVNGSYTIKAKEGEILVFAYVGFIKQEIVIKSELIINVVLQAELKKLDEIIVIGYGTQKKSDITGSVVSVTSDQITQTPVSGIDQALQGRAAGVTVTSNSGQPGSGVTMRIRGIGTVNNSDPLYVVDGISLGNISFINPGDIESIEILKDASATAIYGSRGANGVVLINTRKGSQDGKMTATIDVYKGVQNCWRKLDLMNSNEYAKFKGYDATDPTYSSFSDWVYKKFNLATNPYIPNNIDYSKYNTNWQDVIFRNNAQITSYHVSFEGGNKVSNYNISAGYFDQDGIIISSNFKRLTFRINSAHKVSRLISVGENVSFMNSSSKGVATNNENYSVLNSAISLAPWDPVRYPDGRITPSSTTNLKNPISMVEMENPHSSWNRIVGNVYTDITPFEGLTFKSDIGIDLSYGDGGNFKPKYFISANDNMSKNFLQKDYQKYSMWLWENTLTYKKVFAQKHDLTLLAGMTAQDGTWDYLGGSKSAIPNESPNLWYLDAATQDPTIGGRAWEWSMLSYLGRVNYSYNNRYLLTLSVRRDGSSRFGVNNRWGVFPSMAAGWKISEEDFFAPFKQTINQLKLRLGWGRIGNQEIGNYAYTTNIVSGTTFTGYVFGNPQAIIAGAAPLNIANNDLKWETTEQSNAGLDLAFFDNRLTASIDYFIKDTKDMLVAIPVPGNVGLRYYPMVNAGSVRNSGLEFSADYKQKIAEIFFSVGGNFSTINNKVLSLGGGEDIYSATFFGENLTRTRVGDPIGSFYGYQVAGIFQDKYDVQEHINSKGQEIQPTAKPGDLKFVNMNDDNKIDASDKVNLGSPIPKFTYGFNASIEFKGLDLQVFFQGVNGNKLFNCNRYFTEGNGYTNLGAEMINAWNGKGTSNSLPDPAGSADNLRASSRYIEDGSYLRLKNIQLGYKLPPGLVAKAGITSWRFYLSATNLLTFTKYSGFDPEIGITNGLDMGVDRGNYPQARTFTIGTTLQF